MKPGVRSAIVSLALVACGSVPESGAIDGGADTSTGTFDPFVDAAANPFGDAADDACGQHVQVAYRDFDDAGVGCKFFVGADCNGKIINGSSGACDESDAGDFTIHGICVVGGKTTGSFSAPASSCDCNDASVMVTVAHEKCQPQ
jgi:hypothetical protein